MTTTTTTTTTTIEQHAIESRRAAQPRARRQSRAGVYAIEGALLGLFMVAACAAVVVVEHPASPVRRAVGSDVGRRAIVGAAMGLTAVALIYSPWGRRSGPHFNPAMTVATWRMGRLAGRDAAGYVVAQFLGAAAGVGLAHLAAAAWVGHPAVRHVATVPGAWGAGAAWGAEFAMTLVLMCAVLWANRSARGRRYTGWVAGGLVAVYITFEAPVSGMSMNPARTFGSAAVGGIGRGGGFTRARRYSGCWPASN